MTTPASSTSTVHGLTAAPNNSLAPSVSASPGMGGASASTVPAVPTAPASTPVLRSATALGTAASTTIDLEFDSAMLAGSGTITITDGAVQTVIDRATGQPTMRVVGATDTHTIPASSVSIDGKHVKLNVAGLLAGHQYSIVMAGGVLVSDTHVAFAGVRSTSQVQFVTTPADGPALDAKSIENKTLASGGHLTANLTFSQAVTDLTAAALSAPNASIGTLTKVGDGHSWIVELLPSGTVEATGNTLVLDMSRLHNASGVAGKGSIDIGSYAVDTKAPTATIAMGSGALTPGHDLVATVTFSEAVAKLDPAALQAQNASVKSVDKTDDPKVWLVTLSGAANTTAGGNVLSLDMGKVGDLAGNPGSGIVKSAGYVVDTQAPESSSIVLAGTTLKIGGGIGVTFTFSEAVKDFSSAINAPHAKVANLAPVGDGHIWTATLQALDANTSTGNLVTLDMSKVEDVNGVHGSGSKVSSSGYAVDTKAPEVVAFELTGDGVSTAGGMYMGVKFSEKVSLDASAISAPHATVLSLFSDDGIYWSAFLRKADTVEASANTLTIDLSKVHDLNGNAGSGTYVAPLSYDVDTVAPTASIALSGTELLNGGSIDVTIKLSDRMSGEDVQAALVTPAAVHGALTTTDDGLTWKTTLTPISSGISDMYAVSLDMSRLHDAHLNAGAGSVTSANYVVDTLVTTFAGHHIGIDEGHSPIDNDYISDVHFQTFDGSLSAPIAPGQILRLTFDDDNGRDDPTDRHVDLAFDNGKWHLVGQTGSASETNDPGYWNYASEATRFADGVHTVRTQVIDGSHYSAAFTQSFTIDTVAPHLLTSPDGASGSATDDLVFTFDEAMAIPHGEGYYYINFTDADGNLSYGQIYESEFSADHKTLTMPASEHKLASGKDYRITLPWALTDLAGNQLAQTSDLHFRTSGVDTLPPRAKAAASLTGAGIYGIGKQIDIAVSFSEAVKVAGTGTPSLHLSNGGIASFDHFGVDDHTMVFRYVVGGNGEDNTDTAHGGNVLTLKETDYAGLAGHVSDASGNLLDQAHISFYNFDVPYADGYGTHPSGGGIQVIAHGPSAPGAPVLDAGSDTGLAGDRMTNQNKPLLTGDGAASYATVKLFDNGTLIAQTHAGADNHWQFDAGAWSDAGKQLADGMHTLTVRQYDSANNESAASSTLTLTIDTQIAAQTLALHPDSDSGSSHTDLLTNVLRPTFSGTGEVSALLELFDGSTKLTEIRVDTGGIWQYSVTSDMTQGPHTISVKQTDLAGNVSEPTSMTITIDTAKPAAPGKPVLAAASDSGVSDHDGITKVKTPTFTGTASEAGGSVELYDGETLLGTATVGADKSWSFTVGSQAGRPATLDDRTHQITVKQVDAAGNHSDASVALSVTIDTGAPWITYATWIEQSGSNWLRLQFNEEIVFTANGPLDVLDAGHAPWARYTSDVRTNWKIEMDEDFVHDVLELSLHTTVSGSFYVASGSTAVQDLAGNVAIIGTGPYYAGLTA